MSAIFPKKVVADEEIMQALREGVEKYVYLIDRFPEIDITNNTDDVNEWKKTYAKFFVFMGEVNQKQNRNIYFSALESYKKVKCCDIDDAISIMKDFLDKFVTCQKSFVSKAIHMLDHDLPIIDRNVSIELGFKKEYNNIKGDNKKELTIELYKDLHKKIQDIINSKEGERIINMFDSYFPEYKDVISPVKKIDFYYWKKYDLETK